MHLRFSRSSIDTFFCACLNSAGHFSGLLRMYGMYTLGLEICVLEICVLEICGRTRGRKGYGLEQFIGASPSQPHNPLNLIHTNRGSYCRNRLPSAAAEAIDGWRLLQGHVTMPLYDNETHTASQPQVKGTPSHTIQHLPQQLTVIDSTLIFTMPSGV